MVLSKKSLLALLPFIFQASAQASGSGTTTRYWDCCKASCGWPGKLTLASGSDPVTSCDANDNPITNYNAVSGCDGGSTYMCSSQTPWAISATESYGFAATTISGGTEASWCCACYQLTFTSTSIAGKTMIVQATNTGGDLGSNQFDLAMPGGGFGIFDGCVPEWGTPSTGWGAQYGGLTSRSQCDAFPAALRPGCYWRFDWFENADNPSVTFKQVECPAALTAKSGCVRANDSINESPTGPAVVPTYASTGAAPSSTPTSSKVSTSAKSSTSAKASSTAVGGGTGTAPKYGQCGGTGYTGPTTCAAGSTCTYSNAYYSQCL
ncbi:hypothetical protein D0Z07_5746 [Hyphodiscus hymeniophilus]|uniref:Cellulase n=1 Tax=Hyphodiscus hymeniophilus TaxID=353542 RepID=A0A9P6VHH2_9HELO|nr:hypothetical protein D0Z07_5746 [Hyphodiscus hymeniophilus]